MPETYGLDWNRISEFEMRFIEGIVARAAPFYEQRGIADNKLTMTMDIAGAHLCLPIALDELLSADQETFEHDVFGIREHFNRQIFKLEGCFAPRTAIH